MALPVFQRTIVTEAGDVIAGAEVEVVNEATGLAADIFSDRAGNTPRTNPFFTGADGFAKFFAAPAEYRITATGPSGGIVFRFVVLTNDAALMNNNTGGNTLNTLAAQNANSVNITGGTASLSSLTGTAVTQSATDATAGRLLKVGDFGFGGGFILPATSNFDNTPDNSMVTGSAADNAPEPARTFVVHTISRGTTRKVQVAYASDGPSSVSNIFHRYFADGFSQWNKVYDTGNLFTSTTSPGNAPLFASRAWVNFNGIGTVAIRASGNVSSITDNGTGDYTVNFTTAMPDANYCVSTSARMLPTGINSDSAGVHQTVNPTAGAVRVQNKRSNGAFIDTDFFYVAVVR